MTYSLVSAATLGFDLVRLPAGRQVAEVLLVGLAAGPDQLRVLAAAHPSRTIGHAERAARSVRARRARESAANGTPGLAGFSARLGTLSTTQDAPAALAAQLQVSMIGSSTALERLIHDDLLDPGATQAVEQGRDVEIGELAAQVLTDAALAAYAAATLPPALRRELSVPFASAGLRASDPRTGTPSGLDLGPLGERVTALLAEVRDTDAAGRDRWRQAADVLRARRRGWATAMHEASWAAHVCGRTRAAAAAQLLAVQAFDEAGFSAADGAAGVWNLLAGCVQGLVLADVVDDVALEVLLEPWSVATGRALAVA